jgi:hypothetical protein
LRQLLGTLPINNFLPGFLDGGIGEVRKLAGTVEFVLWDVELDSHVVDWKKKNELFRVAMLIIIFDFDILK